MSHVPLCEVCHNSLAFCECKASAFPWPEVRPRPSPPRPFHPYAGHEAAYGSWPPVLPRSGLEPSVPPSSVQAGPPLEEAKLTRGETPAGETGYVSLRELLSALLAKRAASAPVPTRPAAPSSPRVQSRRMSLLESVLNVLLGFSVSVLANWFILPHYGVSPRLGVSAEIGIWFTAISFARSYLIRRLFNKLHSLEE